MDCHSYYCRREHLSQTSFNSSCRITWNNHPSLRNWSLTRVWSAYCRWQWLTMMVDNNMDNMVSKFWVIRFYDEGRFMAMQWSIMMVHDVFLCHPSAPLENEGARSYLSAKTDWSPGCKRYHLLTHRCRGFLRVSCIPCIHKRFMEDLQPRTNWRIVYYYING